MNMTESFIRKGSIVAYHSFTVDDPSYRTIGYLCLILEKPQPEPVEETWCHCGKNHILYGAKCLVLSSVNIVEDFLFVECQHWVLKR